MKKSLRIIFIIVGILLLLFVLATLLAPPIAKSYINKHGEELTGRRVHIDAVRLNLFTGHVAVRDAALYEDDGTTPFVSFDTLDVSVKLRKLLGSELFIRRLTLAGLNVRVTQRDTVFNFSSLIAHFAKDKEEPDEEKESSWVLTFHNVALHHGQIHYADLGRGSRWDFNDFNLRVPDFSMGGEEATHAGLNLMLGKEGKLSATMHYDAKSNDFNSTIDLQHFDIEQVKPYLTDMMRVGTLNGHLGLHVDVQGNLSHITELLLKGSVSLDALHFGDKREELASCNHIGIDIKSIDLGKNRYHIGTIAIDGLTSHYDVRTDGNTFSQLMIPAPAKKADSTQTATTTDNNRKAKKAADFTVDHFLLTDAAFTYADHTLPDAFEFPVRHIKMEADNLRLHGDNAANITADLPEGGRAVIRWKGNINDWKERQDLLFIISNLKLTQLSPYLVAYLGQPFTEGTLSFRSRNSINHSMLNGKNQLDIYKVSVGDRRKDVEPQMKLPLKAALFILKDKDDKIDLEVPVSGNINSPEFSYMKMVWKTLGNLLVKVATSPLRALGNAMGLNSEDLEFLAISPDQFDFTSEQYYHIESLAKVMQRDSLIHVTFEQQLDAGEEEALLQRADHRNELLRHHLSELGLSATRYEVTTVLSDTLDQPGYKIISKLEEGDL